MVDDGVEKARLGIWNIPRTYEHKGGGAKASVLSTTHDFCNNSDVHLFKFLPPQTFCCWPPFLHTALRISSVLTDLCVFYILYMY